MGYGNESLLKQYWSHDQDGRYAHKHFVLQNQKAEDLETWYAALGARVLLSLFK